MLRSVDGLHSASKLFGYTLSSDLINNSLCVQCVRWRKPRWLPTAKSKIFRIPVKPVIEESEAVEIRRLYNRYRTDMHAVRHFLWNEHLKTTDSSSLAAQEIKAEEENHLRCIKENEEWNRQVALLREARLEREQQVRQEKVLANLAAAEQREKERKEMIEHIVREEKERAKFYITPENIDKAIEDALASTVDNNFAIDVEGNIYRGRRTKPQDISLDELEKIQVPAQAS